MPTGKKLKLEDQIYLCKYHDIDKDINISLRINNAEQEKFLNILKSKGLYEKYRNLSDEEYLQLIKQAKKNKKETILRIEEPEKRNHLLDLNDMLFEELHTLMDDSLTEAQLNEEVKRSKQLVAVSQTIINNADLLLRAKIHYDKMGNNVDKIAPLLRIE